MVIDADPDFTRFNDHWSRSMRHTEWLFLRSCTSHVFFLTSSFKESTFQIQKSEKYMDCKRVKKNKPFERLKGLLSLWYPCFCFGTSSGQTVGILSSSLVVRSFFCYWFWFCSCVLSSQLNPCASTAIKSCKIMFSLPSRLPCRT